MPTILDAGTTRMSNADMLEWINKKKAQNDADLASDKAAGRKKVFLPDNYQRALRKHERELTARKYPYTDNQGAYAGENRITSADRFVKMVEARLMPAVNENLKSNLASGEKTKEQALKAWEKEIEAKTLTDTEQLQIQNLAPQAVEILQNIIVDWEDRFTAEDMEAIVQAIGEVFRCGDTLPEEPEFSNIRSFVAVLDPFQSRAHDMFTAAWDTVAHQTAETEITETETAETETAEDEVARLGYVFL